MATSSHYLSAILGWWCLQSSDQAAAPCYQVPAHTTPCFYNIQKRNKTKLIQKWADEHASAWKWQKATNLFEEKTEFLVWPKYYR